MISLDKEFMQWLTENRSLYEHLKHHESALYYRFMPVYEVLMYLHENEMKSAESADEDIVKIFQVGMEYLHSQISVCRIYIDKVFGGDLHAFLAYDAVVNYILFVEDLQYELHEHKIRYSKTELDALTQELEEIVVNKKDIPDNLDLYVDGKIHHLLGDKDFDFNSIVDIFVEIANTLEIDLYNEDDYIIGKEI